MLVIVMTVSHASLVTVMTVAVVIVTVVIVVTVVMMVAVVVMVVGMASADGMMMPVATGVHMGASVAMGVRQERERSHARRDEHGRQRNEDRDGPSLRHALSVGKKAADRRPDVRDSVPARIVAPWIPERGLLPEGFRDLRSFGSLRRGRRPLVRAGRFSEA